MLINITSKQVPLSVEQREWIHRRLQFTLGRFVARIRSVSVIFNDANGDRGGVDKQCRLRISLIPSRDVVVNDIDKSVESVMANVAERAARSVARVLDRLHDDHDQVERVIFVGTRSARLR